MDMESNKGKILFALFVAIIAFIGYRSTNRTITQPLEAPAASISKEAIEPIIKEYILNHPEVIIESVDSMQKRKSQDMEKETQDNVDKNKAEIENSLDSPVAGNKDGKMIVVMFYDYNCNYCKKANEVLNQLIDANKEVKVIYKPMPILGPSSEYLSKLMLAIYKTSPDKFKVIHDNIMGLKQLEKSDLEGVVMKNSLSLPALEAEMNKQEIQDMQAKIMNLAAAINIHGAPVFIINGRFHQGLMDLDMMKQMLSIVAETPKVDAATSAQGQ
jgi:protein-disulfide isomerase